MNDNQIVDELTVHQAQDLIDALNKAVANVDPEDGIDLLISNSGEYQISGRFEYSGGFDYRFNDFKNKIRPSASRGPFSFKDVE